mmetsp:Transcript_89395/g.191694  ORF Transcript_89395/g.191694 Transcript_89395/m.191694 type:complete len:122 (+) Transcript_89395:54-419(+)
MTDLILLDDLSAGSSPSMESGSKLPKEESSGFLASFDPLAQSPTTTTPAPASSTPLGLPDSVAAAFVSQGQADSAAPAQEERLSSGLTVKEQRELMEKVQNSGDKMRGKQAAASEDPFAGI